MATAQTRTDILDAAERLFARTGFTGVSIRQITREAGVNVASIHYHFGGKEDVLRAVTDRIVGPLNERRFELLAGCLERSDPAPVEQVLDAFIRPDIETLQRLQERGPTVAHFLGRTYSDQTPWIQAMAQDQFGDAARRFVPAILGSVPHLTTDEVAWRLARITAVIVHMFASWPDAGMSDVQAEAALRRLIVFLAGGLQSVPPAGEEVVGEEP